MHINYYIYINYDTEDRLKFFMSSKSRDKTFGCENKVIIFTFKFKSRLVHFDHLRMYLKKRFEAITTAKYELRNYKMATGFFNLHLP